MRKAANKMIAKIPTGVEFFDKTYGGAYQGRVLLLTGRAGSGKTIFGLQFLAQGLKLEERSLLLSARPAEDVALSASAFGIPVDTAIESGNLIILEYSEFVPGRDREDQLKLPPDSFLQLKEIIEGQGVQRIVLDTVLPWVALTDQESLAEHVFSFVRVFHRLGVSSIFTLPKPASPAAMKLRRLIEDVVPISVTLNTGEKSGGGEWVVNKYLGSELVSTVTPYIVQPKIGLVEKRASTTSHNTSFSSRVIPPEARMPEKINPVLQAPVTRNRPSFSDVLFRDDVKGASKEAPSGWGRLAFSGRSKDKP